MLCSMKSVDKLNGNFCERLYVTAVSVVDGV